MVRWVLCNAPVAKTENRDRRKLELPSKQCCFKIRRFCIRLFMQNNNCSFQSVIELSSLVIHFKCFQIPSDHTLYIPLSEYHWEPFFSPSQDNCLLHHANKKTSYTKSFKTQTPVPIIQSNSRLSFVHREQHVHTTLQNHKKVH